MWDEDAWAAYVDGITGAEPDEFTDLTRSSVDQLRRAEGALDSASTRLVIGIERATDSFRSLSEALRASRPS